LTNDFPHYAEIDLPLTNDFPHYAETDLPLTNDFPHYAETDLPLTNDFLHYAETLPQKGKAFRTMGTHRLCRPYLQGRIEVRPTAHG
jgi:hypothetical protein